MANANKLFGCLRAIASRRRIRRATASALALVQRNRAAAWRAGARRRACQGEGATFSFSLASGRPPGGVKTLAGEGIIATIEAIHLAHSRRKRTAQPCVSLRLAPRADRAPGCAARRASAVVADRGTATEAALPEPEGGVRTGQAANPRAACRSASRNSRGRGAPAETRLARKPGRGRQAAAKADRGAKARRPCCACATTNRLAPLWPHGLRREAWTCGLRPRGSWR